MTYYVAAVPSNLDPASYPFPEVCPCCCGKLWNPSSTWYGWRYGTGLTTDATIQGRLWCSDCETQRQKEEANHENVNSCFALPGPLARVTWARLPVAFVCGVCANLVTEVTQGTNPGNLLCCGQNMNSYTGVIPPPTGDFWHCDICGEVVEARTLPLVGTLICCGQNMTHGLP